MLFFFFFFQAEDGIRDHCVTGVQTCALPISCQPYSRRGAITASDLPEKLADAPAKESFPAFPRSGSSRPRAVTLSTDRISPFRTSRALSKLFTVGQTWRGSRQRKSPTRGPEAPPATAKGRCSSLGESGVSSRCPSTRQVGTPASADTALCPASQVT